VLDETQGIARNILLDTGYSELLSGNDSNECEILVRVNHPSPQIAHAVERDDKEYGAGD
jgi:S-adenosylmethionine synthetase